MSARSKRAVPELVTRHVGFCAMCEGDFKLTPEMKLVHHGYLRPGDGRIHGDCPFVHLDPYEVSCEPLKPYRARLREQARDARERLRELESGTVTYITRGEVVRKSWRRGDEEFVLREFSIGVTPWYDFEREIERAIRETERRIESLDREIARTTKWIDAWVAKPIRTIEEQAAEEQRQRAARAAEREAARAARKAKRDAIDAKHAALAKKKEDLRVEIRDAALALSASWESRRGERAAQKERDALARKIKKASKWFYDVKAFECVDALIALDLAERHTVNGHTYVDRTWRSR
jgi:hypothetical protein